jgi:hypothetical protein
LPSRESAYYPTGYGEVSEEYQTETVHVRPVIHKDPPGVTNKRVCRKEKMEEPQERTTPGTSN